MEIRPFQAEDESALIALWERCKLTRPWNDSRKDVERKLGVQRELFLVGHGAALMRRAEEALKERGCPKVNLAVRTANAEAIAFYRRLGYAPDDVVPLGKRLIPD